VVHLSSNDLWQIKTGKTMAKKKSRKKSGEVVPENPPKPAPAGAELESNGISDYGGMDMRNFKKNLGCGG
jgi:hypothetical protein